MAGKSVEITAENFEQEVMKSSSLVVVDFWATWCGPCLAIAPILEQLAEQYGDKLKVGKVNVDKHQALAMKFGITSIPTLLFVKGGEVKESVVGSRPKAALEKIVDKYL